MACSVTSSPIHSAYDANCQWMYHYCDYNIYWVSSFLLVHTLYESVYIKTTYAHTVHVEHYYKFLCIFGSHQFWKGGCREWFCSNNKIIIWKCVGIEGSDGNLRLDS